MLNEMEITSVTENNLLLTYLADPYMLAAEYWALFLSPRYLIGICSLVQRAVICSKSPHTGRVILRMNSYLNSAVNIDDKILSFHAW